MQDLGDFMVHDIEDMENNMQQSLVEKCANSTFTLDFVIAGKKHTLKDIHLCQNCQLDIRDNIENLIFNGN